MQCCSAERQRGGKQSACCDQNLYQDSGDIAIRPQERAWPFCLAAFSETLCNCCEKREQGRTAPVSLNQLLVGACAPSAARQVCRPHPLWVVGHALGPLAQLSQNQLVMGACAPSAAMQLGRPHSGCK